MKISDIIVETVTLVEVNSELEYRLGDGTLWVGGHFTDRASARGGENAIRPAVGLISRLKNSPLLKDIIAIPVRNNETFILYDPSYNGVAVYKTIETRADKTRVIAYVLKTVSSTLYPKEDQKLFMIDDNPRIFNHNDYLNFPLDIKRYIIQTWKQHYFDEKEVEKVRRELLKKNIIL